MRFAVRSACIFPLVAVAAVVLLAQQDPPHEDEEPKKDGTYGATYCPINFMGQLNGIYYYYSQKCDGTCNNYATVGDTVLHNCTGPCPNCPPPGPSAGCTDPITVTGGSWYASNRNTPDDKMPISTDLDISLKGGGYPYVVQGDGITPGNGLVPAGTFFKSGPNISIDTDKTVRVNINRQGGAVVRLLHVSIDNQNNISKKMCPAIPDVGHIHLGQELDPGEGINPTSMADVQDWDKLPDSGTNFVKMTDRDSGTTYSVIMMKRITKANKPNP